MAKKKQKGGRKPVNPAEKVILVGFYVKKSIVDSIGGMEKAREVSKVYLEHQAEIEETGHMAFHG